MASATSIRRSPKRERFTIVNNALIDDGRLSFDAVGLLIYLLSKPDDWIVTVADLCRRGRCKEYKIRRIMAELQAAGYVTLETVRGERGALAGRRYVVSEDPTVAATSPKLGFSRCRENSDLRKTPTVGKTTPLLNTDSLPKTEYPSIVNGTMDGAPAGNSTNGTGPAPAKPRTRRKATPRTPLQLGQGSTIYRDVVELTPNATQRAMLDAAFEKHGERAMRDGLARWLAKGWKPTNVPGMVDFLDGGDKGRRDEARDEAFWASVQW